MLQLNHMVWKVHQPKLGRYYPPAPLKHFVFLPVSPSGLQGRRASFFVERSDHLHGVHFNITWMRWNSNRNWKTCLATAERRPSKTLRSQLALESCRPRCLALDQHPQATMTETHCAPPPAVPELLEMLEKWHSCSSLNKAPSYNLT